MSAVFLLVSGRDAPARVDAAEPWVPFEPESSERYQGSDGSVLHVWTVVPEAARGSYLDRAEGGCAVYDGQIAERSDAPLDRTVAGLFHDRVKRDGLDLTSRRVDGDWVALVHDADSDTWRGACDFLGACHLYYGERDGRVVVSNRALVAAATLWGELPPPEVGELALLHAAFSCPLGLRTCWPDVKLLGPSELLEVRRGGLRLVPKTVDHDGDTLSFDEAFAALVDRSKAVKRFPGLRFRVTVTGGKDSRAVLGGLVAADALGAISECYLEGDATLPDAVVGRRLAEHYGLPFVLDPVPFSRRVGAEADVMEAFAIHNFQAELFLNGWDLKGGLSKPRSGDVRGYYGEIYKAHTLPLNPLFFWAAVRVGYQNGWFVDPWKILRRSARRHLIGLVRGYLDDAQARGYDPAGMHHRFHREQRMARWCGQAQRSDAMGTLAINPLADRRLFHRYDSLSSVDRAQCRIHFELIRRVDPWLALQPFADFQWKLAGAPSTPAQGGKKAGFAVSPQLQMWREKAAELEEFLRAPGADAFYAVYDQAALLKLVALTRNKPNHRRLKAVMGACAIKHAVQFGVQPRRFTVDQHV